MRRALLGALLLQGCVYLPHTTETYDQQCQTVSRQMTLKAHQLVYFGHVSCAGNRECAYALVGLGAVTAASVVVSGSIVVVGNVVYWLEHQGKCMVG